MDERDDRPDEGDPSKPPGDDEDADGNGDGALHVATEGEDWRFSLDDLEEDEETEEITPGSPSVENAVFVLLGMAVTVFVLAQLLL